MLRNPVKQKLYRWLLKIRPTILVHYIKTLLRFKRVVVENNAGIFWVDPVSHMGQAIILNTFEPDTLRLIQSLLNEDEIFMVVGANEGYFTVLASRMVGQNGRVVTIEPQKRLIEVLNRNIELNSLDNVTVVNVAVNDGSSNSTEIFLSPSTMTGSSSIVNHYFVSKKQAVTCQSLTALFNEYQINRAKLVKIDVEGYETEVIQGAIDLLQNKQIEYVLVDYHLRILQARGLDAGQIHRLLTENGYMLDSLQTDYDPSGYNLYVRLL